MGDQGQEQWLFLGKEGRCLVEPVKKLVRYRQSVENAELRWGGRGKEFKILEKHMVHPANGKPNQSNNNSRVITMVVIIIEEKVIKVE